jgi:hypothetical protein
MVIVENEQILAEMSGAVVIDANSPNYIGAEVGERTCLPLFRMVTFFSIK